MGKFLQSLPISNSWRGNFYYIWSAVNANDQLKQMFEISIILSAILAMMVGRKQWNFPSPFPYLTLGRGHFYYIWSAVYANDQLKQMLEIPIILSAILAMMVGRKQWNFPSPFPYLTLGRGHFYYIWSAVYANDQLKQMLEIPIILSAILAMMVGRKQEISPLRLKS